jgi:hypothetical protein
MKGYLKISAVLAVIALVCAAILAGLNMVTSPIIAKNNEAKETQTIKAIYEDYDSTKSTSTTSEGAITKKIIAKDSDGAMLGTVYIVTGKNAYGTITLMVAIAPNNTVHQVEFLENGQSFAGTVKTHVKSNYNSSKEEVYELNPYSNGEQKKIDDLTEAEVNGIDVKCGATYGATLVKDLVNIALADAKGGNQ